MNQENSIFKYNKDKTIQIYRNATGKNDSTVDASWHYNISNIIGNLRDIGVVKDKPALVIGGDSNGTVWDVRKDVELLMSDQIPKLATGNENSFSNNKIDGKLKNIKSAVDLAAGVLLPAGLGTAYSALGGLSGIVEGIANITGSIDSSGGYLLDPWWTHAWVYEKAPQPLSFSCKFSFSLGQYKLWNAAEEVVKPILNLAAPCMIQHITNFGYYTPFPTLTKLLLDATGLVIDSVVDWVKDKLGFNDEEGLEEKSSLAMRAYDQYTYSIQFGKVLYFPRVIITIADDIQLSSEVDQNGWPVQGSIVLHCKCLTPLTLSASKHDLLSTRFFPSNTTSGNI